MSIYYPAVHASEWDWRLTKRNHIISFVIDGNVDLFNFLNEKKFDIKSIIYHQKCLDMISSWIRRKIKIQMLQNKSKK